MQFHQIASEWYDGYLLDHEPPDWEQLTRLINFRFKRFNTRNTLDDLKVLNQAGTVEEYWIHFERLRAKMLLEGRKFSERDFIDTFISDLKGEVKPLVLAFKPKTMDEALEYALYVECASDSQYRKLKTHTKPYSLPTPQVPKVQYPSKTTVTYPNNRNTLIDQRRALGQCFKCGDKYYPGH
jgi:Ty3 transposon capsid-like protein